jgi:TrmH family RNA methyltransferase
MKTKVHAHFGFCLSKKKKQTYKTEGTKMQTNYEIITSRKNASVLAAAALADKKQRDKTGLFAFEGIKLFEDAAREKTDIEKVFVTERAYEKYKSILESSGVSDKLVFVTEEVYEKLSFESAPQGVFTVARKFSEKEMEFGENSTVMFLDSLGDPGNIGTIIRSADAFGVDAVFVGEGSADIYNPKTVRACMGSLFRVNVKVCTDIASDIENLRSKGFSVYAAMLDRSSEELLSLSLSGKIGFVIGNEGHGVSARTREACTGSVIIPMCEGPESLNAATSASVLMWEAYRTRMKK